MEFDEIVFENRNKDYGAYPLRRKYNRVVIGSIIIAASLFSLSVVIPFLDYLGKSNRKGQEFRVAYSPVRMEKLDSPPEDIYVPPAPPPPPAMENLRYVAPVIVDSIKPMDKTISTVDDVLANNPEETKSLTTGLGNSKDQKGGLSGDSSDDTYVVVEVPPTFQGGGIEKFRDWVSHKTVYPDAAQKSGIRGTVIILFIVEKDGSVSDVHVVQSVNPILDAEAVKAIESSPKWSPGIQRGKPVRVRFSIPLVFSFGR
jgi:periplasmic protein TonB